MALNQEKQLQDILEIVEFLKDNSVTKEYLEEKLSDTKNDLMNHIDTFIGLHQKLDIELTALRSKCDRLENMVRMMAKQFNFKLD